MDAAQKDPARLSFDPDDAIDLSVTEVRAMLHELDDPIDLISALDQAQADVFSGKCDVAYVIIRINR